MILTKKQLLTLREVLSGHEEFSEIIKEIDDAQDVHSLEVAKAIRYKNCEHQWEPPSKAERYKIGDPEYYGIDKNDKYAVAELWMYYGGYCKKCGLKFRHSNVSMKKVQEALTGEETYSISVDNMTYTDSIIWGMDSENK